eukprot:gene19630-26315_t
MASYKMYQLDPNQMYDDVDAFNAFFNRQEGHEVASVGVQNIDGYTNMFYIRARRTFDEVTGVSTIAASQINALAMFEQKFSPSEPNADGFIINTTTQTTITLQMCLKK